MLSSSKFEFTPVIFMQAVLKLIKPRQQSILLAFMLETLHLSIWLDFGSPLSRSLMLVHLGLFLIWQPVWRGDAKMAWYKGLLFIILTTAFVIWMNWFLLFCWLILLTAFCGGRANIHRQERYINIIVLVFLISELLITCTVTLFDVEISTNVTDAFRLLLPFLPLLLFLIPSNQDQRSLNSVDFIHALTTALLISLLVFGSLLNMYHFGAEYLVSLIQTLIAIGALLFVISWLLTPHAGFSGLSQLWMQSILNIGTPLGHWLEEIANLFEQQSSPEEFLSAVIEELITLPWVTGTVWKTSLSEGRTGEITKHETEIRTDNFVICIYSNAPVGGALYLHCKLLVQVIDNFYEAKMREKKLTQQTHLQAIYETGARVTHDIKNLLQSLHAITSITSQASVSPASQAVIEKQLPHLTQRLQMALDKLQAPETVTPDNVYAAQWWRELQTRHNETHIHFESSVDNQVLIPADLFDSVLENLLENLKDKSRTEGNVDIDISLIADESQVCLLVSDNGSRIPDELADSIFREAIKSDNGLGIGLYQAARQAESNGYSLTLQENSDTCVTFRLAKGLS